MSGSKSDFHNGSLARLILTKSISTPAKVPSLSINYTNAKVRVTSSLTVTGKRETFCSSSLESIMNITDCTKDILAEIIRRLPMKEILVLGSVNRQWHEVTENFLSSSSLYLSYRLILNCEYPASVGVDGTSSELNESIKISRLNEFSNSPLVGRISRLAIYYPIVLPESSLGAMPFPLILLASRMPNVKIIEFFGNDPNVFYTHIGRPTLKYLFPQINQVLVSCDLAEFRLKLESNENNDFLPLVKLVVKVNYDTAIVAAFAKIDTFLEALRAEELINRNLFK